MAYSTITRSTMNRIGAVNRRNGYTIKTSALIQLIKQHRRARKKGDIYRMERIEYRLTDINFHYEVSMLVNGSYDKLLAEQKGEIA